MIISQNIWFIFPDPYLRQRDCILQTLLIVCLWEHRLNSEQREVAKSWEKDYKWTKDNGACKYDATEYLHSDHPKFSSIDHSALQFDTGADRDFIGERFAIFYQRNDPRLKQIFIRAMSYGKIQEHLH